MPLFEVETIATAQLIRRVLHCDEEVIVSWCSCPVPGNPPSYFGRRVLLQLHLRAACVVRAANRLLFRATA